MPASLASSCVLEGPVIENALKHFSSWEPQVHEPYLNKRLGDLSKRIPLTLHP